MKSPTSIQSPTMILMETHDPEAMIGHGQKYLEEQLDKTEEKIVEAANETVRAMLATFTEEPETTKAEKIIQFLKKVKIHLLDQVQFLKIAIETLEIENTKNDATQQRLKNYIQIVLLKVLDTLKKNLEKCGLEIAEIIVFKDFLNRILTSLN